MKSFAIKKGAHAIAVVFHDELKRTLDRKIIKQMDSNSLKWIIKITFTFSFAYF